MENEKVVDTHTGTPFLSDTTALAEAQKIVAALQATGQVPTPQAIVAMMTTREPDGGPGKNQNMAPVNPIKSDLANAMTTKKEVVAEIYKDGTWALV